jgi:hypothetical protein
MAIFHRLLVATILLFLCLTAAGQSKVPVFISATVGDGDQQGRQLEFEIKEAIRGSYGFRLV